MSLIKNLIPESQYSTKCPYSMTPKGICIHNTANDAPAINERNYMAKAENQNEVSFHIAIDDKEAIQCIPFNRNAWHAGDGGSGQGNRNYIAVEICYSRSGGDRFIKAEQRAAKEVAALLREYGWDISNVKKHQDFSGKYCPHRTLDLGWQRFLNMVQDELNAHKKVHVGEYLNVKEFNEGFGIFKDDSSWETWNRLTYLGCPISAIILDNPRKNVYKVRDCRYGFEGYCYIEENNNTTFTSYQAYVEKKEENKEVLFRVLADGIQVSDTCKAKWIPEIIEEQLKKGAKDIKVFQCN